MLLGGWGGESDADPPERIVTDAEMRETLIVADDDLRGQVLWHLGHWSNNPGTLWPERLVLFLKTVWPKQRALRNGMVSSRLANLAIESGDSCRRSSTPYSPDWCRSDRTRYRPC